MKVVIAGSRSLPRGQGPRLLVRTLAALPRDAEVLLRAPLRMMGAFTVPDPDRAGHFEKSVAVLCSALSVDVRWCCPHPDPETRGRASVYLRDIDMVEQADLVLLFFRPEEATDGYSGTAHMMEKSLDANRPTYAYSVDNDGKVERVGEYDPEELYSGLAPAT